MQMREGGWLAYFFSGFLLPSLDSAERYIYADEVGFVFSSLPFMVLSELSGFSFKSKTKPKGET